jgi:hypothetical protein
MTNLITGETWGDNVDAARALLLAEAEKPFDQLRPAVAEARAALLAQLAGVSVAQAAFRPPEGDGEDAWSISEAVRHVINVETRMAARIRKLGRGEEPHLPSTGPGYMADVDTAPLPALVKKLQASRAALLAAVDEIDGRERLDTLDRHRVFGELNCRGWFRLQGLHEQDHARQIGKLKAMAAFPRA